MANVKISQLTQAAALTGTEIVPVVQNNVTVKTTAQDIANLAGGGDGAQTINIQAIGGTWNYPGTISTGPGASGNLVFTNIGGTSSSFSGTQDLFRIPLPSFAFDGMNYMTQPTATSVIISKTPKAAFVIQYIQNIQNIEFSDLEGLYSYSQYSTFTSAVNIQFNNVLTTLSFPKVEFIAATSFYWNNNAFNQATVDYIINLFALYAETFDVSMGGMMPYLSLTGGTTSPPSSAALPDIAILTSKNWIVSTN